LLAELPGILLWALEGLARLSARQRFVQPASAAETIRQIEDLGSPIGTFIRERCELGPDKTVERSELYGAWRDWTGENGLRAGSAETFGRDLTAAVPGLKTTMPRVEGKRERQYTGIALVPGLSGAQGEFEPIGDLGLPGTGGTCAKALH
jgi:putative DNA primase/helicase